VGLWRLELSQKYLNLLPGLHAQGLFGLRKDFFDFSSNPVSIDAYTVVMPRLSMGLEYAFYRGQCSEVSLYGNSLYEFSRSSEQFEIESAWGLSTGLRYKMALDPQEVHSVSAGYRFERLWQNTTFAERTRSEMGLEINFTRKL
jgi:hypothetical protein